ncbi:hypothetical protein [Aurantiacibacter sp. MUD61]|uniref:hypothetical protein n=1 Tax=Aurantiacibacter sp. MUD61 TaxID=3009083 RepID=UPI0022F12211|nr:hypothetical protein [Aurantiacibacter sp. MUD61]
MSHWQMGTEPDSKGNRDLTIDIQTDDSVGTLKGTVTFQDRPYSVTGHWAAEGSVPGRNYSCLAMCGPDHDPAPEMLTLSGTLVGKGYAPDSIQANVTRTDSKTGLQYGYGGKLLPM